MRRALAAPFALVVFAAVFLMLLPAMPSAPQRVVLPQAASGVLHVASAPPATGVRSNAGVLSLTANRTPAGHETGVSAPQAAAADMSGIGTPKLRLPASTNDAPAPDHIGSSAAEAQSAKESDEQLRLLPRPVAVGASTLVVGDGTIVLEGVDALPLDASCDAGAGSWPCGMKARTELRNLIRTRSVRCMVPADFGSDEQTIDSRCTLEGHDLGRWLVANGWAKASAGGPYGEAERQAKTARLGLWR